MKRFSILLLLGLGFCIQPPDASGGDSCKSQDKFKEEEYLKKEITENRLDAELPEELSGACSGQDKTKVWTELMIGLSYIESSWDTNCNTPNDANGKPSTGLFQMTKGDSALGTSCFSSQEETKDAKKNIHCAVRKMKELMTKRPSLRESAKAYWGPFGPKQINTKGKGASLIAMVQSACGTGALSASGGYGGGALTNNNVSYWEAIKNYSPFSSGSGNGRSASKSGASGKK